VRTTSGADILVIEHAPSEPLPALRGAANAGDLGREALRRFAFQGPAAASSVPPAKKPRSHVAAAAGAIAQGLAGCDDLAGSTVLRRSAASSTPSTFLRAAAEDSPGRKQRHAAAPPPAAPLSPHAI